MFKTHHALRAMLYLLASKNVAQESKATISVSGQDFRSALTTILVLIDLKKQRAKRNTLCASLTIKQNFVLKKMP